MKSPSMVRIVFSDYSAFLFFLVPVLAVAAYAFSMVFGWLPDFRHVATGDRQVVVADSLGPLLLVGATVAIVGLAKRLRTISDVFVSGRPAEGVISMVRFVKDRGRIEYTYEYESQAYTSGNAVMKTKRTAAFAPGQPVTVYVNASEPSTAFLKELYL